MTILRATNLNEFQTRIREGKVRATGDYRAAIMRALGRVYEEDDRPEWVSDEFARIMAKRYEEYLRDRVEEMMCWCCGEERDYNLDDFMRFDIPINDIFLDFNLVVRLPPDFYEF